MKALVVGATGLIGSHLRAELTGRGIEALGTSTTGAGADLALDLTDAATTGSLLRDVRPDLVVHAAGMASLSEAWQRPAEAFRLNSSGTLNLLEAVARHAAGAHLVFTSSAAVYGPPTGSGLPFVESSPLQPSSPYGASKAAAEILCRQYEREHGLVISIARIFNQIGPGQSANQAPSEFAREIARAEARGEESLILPVGNPQAERDFTDVRDTARALAGLAERTRPGTFNVCSGRGTSLAAIVRMLAATTPLEISIATNPGHRRPADVPRLTGSPEKLERATGWKPEFPLVESLALLLGDWRTDRIRSHED